jgi:beta-lactam-binding protein with PASTA domain
VPVNRALPTLQGAGFRVKRRAKAVNTPADDKVVLDQNPASGEKRDKGSRVILTVGRFEPANLDPDPSASPTPSPTPAPTP